MPLPYFKLTAGFSLLEVLVATLMLCIGLLGFARIEILALHNSETAYFQSITAIQLNTMADYIRACNTTVHPTTCVLNTFSSWKKKNKILLPHAKSNLSQVGNNYLFSIYWQSQIASATTTITL